MVQGPRRQHPVRARNDLIPELACRLPRGPRSWRSRVPLWRTAFERGLVYGSATASCRMRPPDGPGGHLTPQCGSLVQPLLRSFPARTIHVSE